MRHTTSLPLSLSLSLFSLSKKSTLEIVPSDNWQCEGCIAQLNTQPQTPVQLLARNAYAEMEVAVSEEDFAAAAKLRDEAKVR